MTSFIPNKGRQKPEIMMKFKLSASTYHGIFSPSRPIYINRQLLQVTMCLVARMADKVGLKKITVFYDCL